MLRAVSRKVSPFDRLLPDDEKSMVSALSRLAASEKLVRVREIPSVQRQVRNALFLYHPRHGAGGGIDERRLAHYGHLLRYRPHLHPQI